jgi:threonyl-tRNA synthetase
MRTSFAPLNRCAACLDLPCDMIDCAQIEDEVTACFDFLEATYGLFGFEFELKLSTRPEKRLGDEETWDRAEKVRLFIT